MNLSTIPVHAGLGYNEVILTTIKIAGSKVEDEIFALLLDLR